MSEKQDIPGEEALRREMRAESQNPKTGKVEILVAPEEATSLNSKHRDISNDEHSPTPDDKMPEDTNKNAEPNPSIARKIHGAAVAENEQSAEDNASSDAFKPSEAACSEDSKTEIDAAPTDDVVHNIKEEEADFDDADADYSSSFESTDDSIEEEISEDFDFSLPDINRDRANKSYKGFGRHMPTSMQTMYVKYGIE